MRLTFPAKPPWLANVMVAVPAEPDWTVILVELEPSVKSSTVTVMLTVCVGPVGAVAVTMTV